jgi:curved DNA-binding protein CbpA
VKYTHYDYLELAPGSPSTRFEPQYFALLEKLQYGASEAGQDLSGLIRRIHAAYEVLSDPQKRAAYDASLADEAAQADIELKRLLDQPDVPTRRHVQDAPRELVAAVNQIAA